MCIRDRDGAKLGDDFIDAIARNRSLQVLDLSKGYISEDLSSAIVTNTNIREVVFYMCSICASTITALQQSTSLETLGVIYSESDELKSWLPSILRESKSLQAVFFVPRDDLLSSSDWMLIANALASSKTITYLRLDCVIHEKEVFDAVAEAIEKNQKFQWLRTRIADKLFQDNAIRAKLAELPKLNQSFQWFGPSHPNYLTAPQHLINRHRSPNFPKIKMVAGLMAYNLPKPYDGNSRKIYFGNVASK